MKPLSELSMNFVTIGEASLELGAPSAIGSLRGVTGFVRSLPASEKIASMDPEETDARMIACLERISGQQIVLATSPRFHGDDLYRVYDRIRWPFPLDKADELASIVLAAFRSAPSERLAGALYRLRVLTRGRMPSGADDREAEAVVWITELQKFPGDVVLHVLDTWHRRKGGSFWPTWHELERELEMLASRRQVIARLLIKPLDAPPQLEDHTREEVVSLHPAEASRKRVADNFAKFKAEFPT